MEDNPRQETPAGLHEPFTRTERIQQLSEIDSDTTQLLTLTGTALQSLSKAQTSDQPADPADPSDAPLGAFKAAMDAFLGTLHSVDVRLKRQIVGLEEAGIISLKDASKAAAAAAPGEVQTSLEPNGIGQIGGLDVGVLNSRSNKVERDMEAELWARARGHLDDVVDKKAADGNRVNVKMENDG